MILDRPSKTWAGPPPNRISTCLQIKILGALDHLKPINDIASCCISSPAPYDGKRSFLQPDQPGMQELDEAAISETIITPIKQQEQDTSPSIRCPRPR